MFLFTNAACDTGTEQTKKGESETIHVEGGSRFLRACFSRNSTVAYHPPPKSVRRIPSPLIGVIVRLKRETAKRIVSTCLTFAARKEVRKTLKFDMTAPTQVKSLSWRAVTADRGRKEGREKKDRREKDCSRLALNSPATVILSGPTFLLAVKLTTLSANARRPFASRALARGQDISCAEKARTRSSSPERVAKITHWMNARGDMRVRRSRGWSWRRVDDMEGDAVDEKVELLELEFFSFVVRRVVLEKLGGGDWRTFVKTVLRAARTVPKSVKMRPQVVK